MEEEEEMRSLFLIQELSRYTNVSRHSVAALSSFAQTLILLSFFLLYQTISSDDIRMRIETEKNTSDDLKSKRETDVETGKALATAKSLEEEESDSDVEHEIFDEFEQSDRIVTVFAAGESVWPLEETKQSREVANGCAICLCEYDPRDQITWAANKDCPHVFHSDCILQWMLALGRKEQKRRKRCPERSTGDPLRDIITFPMSCPCCRQHFINKPEDIPALTPQQSTEELQSRTVFSDESQEEVQSTAVSTPEEARTDTAEIIADNV